MVREMVRKMIEKLMERSDMSASNRSSQEEVGSPRRISERAGTLKTLTGADEETSGGLEDMDVPGEVRCDRAPCSMFKY